MIRSKPFSIGLILVLCCLLLVVILVSSHRQTAAAPVRTTSDKVAPPSSGQGCQLFIRRFRLSRPLLPASPLLMCRTYLKTHPFVGGPTVKGVRASIVSIQFITSEQASVLMRGEQTGLPPTASICYVKLHGPFTPVAPLAPGAKQLPTVPYGVEIFDAQTGNLLMWWIPSA